MVNGWQGKTANVFGQSQFGLEDETAQGGAYGRSLTNPFGVATPWDNSYQTPLQRMQLQFQSQEQERTNAWWHPGGAGSATVTGTPGTGGAVSSVGGDWAGVDRWNNEVSQAANKFGVPANALKALMKIESNGEDLEANGASAVGPMQVTSSNWGAQAQSMGYDLNDPADNIMMGAFVLKDAYDSSLAWAKANNVDPWKAAFYTYYAGNPYDLSASDDPNQGGSGISTGGYGDQVFGNFQMLNGAGGAAISPGLGGSVPQPSAPMATIWGNNPDVSVSQEIGMTDFARTVHPEWYAYSAAYAPDGQPIGHTGVDVAMSAGSPLYSPSGGTVVNAGGTPYFTYEAAGPNVPGTGELRIQLDNGDIVILGHMQQINLKQGDRVDPGMYVGRSGGFNGDHVHVEYRKRTPGATESGYTIVDPRNYFGGGSAVPTYQGSATTQGQAAAIPGLPQTTGQRSYGSGYKPFWMNGGMTA